MLSMQGFVFVEEIIMNNDLPEIYDYMMTCRSFSGCGGARADNLSSYWFLIQPTKNQTDVESQVYNTTTAILAII